MDDHRHGGLIRKEPLISSKGAVPWGAALFFLYGCAMTAVLSSAGGVYAACPAGSAFESSISLDESAPVKVRDISVPQSGPAKVFMKLNLPSGEARNAAEGEIEIATGGRMAFRNHVWQLTVPASSNLDIANLMVSYSISGSAGMSGDLVSLIDTSSIVGITIIPRQIQRIMAGDKIIFRGFIDVDIDYTRATKSGGYSGTISTSVECR
jgi:hypothetical protein